MFVITAYIRHLRPEIHRVRQGFVQVSIRCCRLIHSNYRRLVDDHETAVFFRLVKHVLPHRVGFKVYFIGFLEHAKINAQRPNTLYKIRAHAAVLFRIGNKRVCRITRRFFIYHLGRRIENAFQGFLVRIGKLGNNVLNIQFHLVCSAVISIRTDGQQGIRIVFPCRFTGIGIKLQRRFIHGIGKQTRLHRR